MIEDHAKRWGIETLFGNLKTCSKLPKPEYFSQDASQAVLLTVHVSESHRQAKVKTVVMISTDGSV